MPNEQNPSLETRVAVLERFAADIEELNKLRFGHLESLIDSEKGTRDRLHRDWQDALKSLEEEMADHTAKNDLRFRTLERHVWVGIGIVCALQFIAPTIGRMLKLP